MHLNKRETGTILAALRHWQDRTPAFEAVDSIATDGGAFEQLNRMEIDQLCEKLNFDDAKPDPRVKDALPGAVKRLLEVPEVRHIAANWASDELLAVRNLLHFTK